MDSVKGKIPVQTWTALGLLWLIYAMNANCREILNRLSPYIIDEYNVTATQFGLLSSAALFALGIFSIPLTMWANKGGVGYRRAKRASILAVFYLVAVLLCGFKFIAATFAVFCVLHMIKGAASGAGESCEVGMIMEWMPKERSGLFVAMHHTGYPWGTFIGGLIITALLNTLGDDHWRICFIIFPVIGLVAWFIWTRYSNEKTYKNFQDNCKNAGYTTVLGTEGEGVKPAPGLMKRIMRNPNLFIMLPVSFLCLFAWTAINYWLTPYITYIGGIDAASSSTLSLIYTLTGGLMQIFWGTISDKLGTKTSMQICCLWLAAVFFAFQLASQGIIWVIILQLAMGLAISAVYAMIYKYVAVCSEPGGVLMGNSLCVCGMYIGGGLASYVVGALIDAGGGWTNASGYMASLYVMAAVMIAAFILVTLFTRETNGKRFKKDFSLVSLKSCNLE